MLCIPLTRRIMLAGVPQDALMWMFVGGYVIFMTKVYVLLPGLGLFFLAVRALYARDEWVVFCWPSHARAVVNRRIDLHV